MPLKMSKTQRNAVTGSFLLQDFKKENHVDACMPEYTIIMWLCFDNIQAGNICQVINWFPHFWFHIQIKNWTKLCRVLLCCTLFFYSDKLLAVSCLNIQYRYLLLQDYANTHSRKWTWQWHFSVVLVTVSWKSKHLLKNKDNFFHKSKYKEKDKFMVDFWGFHRWIKSKIKNAIHRIHMPIFNEG